jgi:hypothetical protein
MASRPLPFILAMEIESARWQANSSVGDTQAYPRDEHCQSAVGAPRIHGELLKLGVDIGQTSVAKYMVKRRAPPSQGWRTFLRNHAPDIAAMDMFVAPTISFRLVYGLLIMVAPPATYSVVWRHSASNRRMDRKSGHGSMRLGTGSPLSHS